MAGTGVDDCPTDATGVCVGATFSRRRLLAGGVALGVAGLAASCGFFGDDGPERFAYGDAPNQFSELWRPANDGPWSTVVTIHGGSWSASTDRTIMDQIAKDLAHQGHAVWNIEYRRLGEAGGGWPGTFADVAKAIDDVATRPNAVPVDLDRLLVLGHSAGGQLALWAAGRTGLPVATVGSAPRVSPRSVVALAPVTDLARCAEQGALEGTCEQVMGGTPEQVPGRYARASPVAMLPLGLPQRLYHGLADTVVPVEESRKYVEAATAAGDDVALAEQADANHFSVLDPDTLAWKQVRATVGQLLA